MKKTMLILGLILTMVLLTACGSNEQKAQQTSEIPTLLDQTEYLLSQDIFKNDKGSSYIGKTVTKRGVYATIQDAFSKVTRYYVWGYLDNTLCCDWQWEFVPAEPDKLPPVGSLIQVKGTFEYDENNALDKYWITGATVVTEQEYTGPQADLNMTAMSDTLERVQVANIVYVPEPFEGKTAFAYGRAAGTNTLEDPYYNDSWQIEYAYQGETPAIGSLITMKGSITNGMITADTIENRKE